MDKIPDRYSFWPEPRRLSSPLLCRPFQFRGRVTKLKRHSSPLLVTSPQPQHPHLLSSHLIAPRPSSSRGRQISPQGSSSQIHPSATLPREDRSAASPRHPSPGGLPEPARLVGSVSFKRIAARQWCILGCVFLRGFH